MGNRKDWFWAFVVTLVVFIIGALLASMVTDRFVDEESLNPETLELASSGVGAGADAAGEAPLDANYSADSAGLDQNVQLDAYVNELQELTLKWLYYLVGAGLLASLAWHVIALRTSAAGRSARTSCLGAWIAAWALAILAAGGLAFSFIRPVEAYAYASSEFVVWSSVLSVGAMTLLYWLATGVGVRHVLVPSVPFFSNIRR